MFQKKNSPPEMGEFQVDNLIKLIYVDIGWSLTAAIATSHFFDVKNFCTVLASSGELACQLCQHSGFCRRALAIAVLSVTPMVQDPKDPLAIVFSISRLISIPDITHSLIFFKRKLFRYFEHLS